MDEVKIKYNDIYKELINNNKSKIIEAFVIYYGEEYRSFIVDKLNNINFFWFVHSDLEDVCKSFCKNITTSTSEDVLKHLIDMKKISLLGQNEIVGFQEDHNDYNFVKTVLNGTDSLANYFSFLKNNEIKYYVGIPIFLTRDVTILHEINHHVTSNNLAFIEDEGKKAIVSKMGFHIFGDDKILFEELLNELSAIEITDIFHQFGNIFDNNVLNIMDGNLYRKFLPLVQPFYLKYKDVIKSVSIGESYNLIYKYVNKDIFNRYVEYVVDIVKNNINNKDYVLDNSTISLCKVAVDNMDKKDKIL